jgi:hypothetical protein
VGGIKTVANTLSRHSPSSGKTFNDLTPFAFSKLHLQSVKAGTLLAPLPASENIGGENEIEQ